MKCQCQSIRSYGTHTNTRLNLTLRSKVNVILELWIYATRCFMAIRPYDIPNSISALVHVFQLEQDSCLDVGMSRPQDQDIYVSSVHRQGAVSPSNFKSPVIILCILDINIKKNIGVMIKYLLVEMLNTLIYSHFTIKLRKKCFKKSAKSSFSIYVKGGKLLFQNKIALWIKKKSEWTLGSCYKTD